MNYDEMEAGREMDALVAEKVMGWYRGTQGLYYFCEEHGSERWITDDPQYADRKHWRPSEDISAAWEVVEKLTSIGAFGTIYFSSNKVSVTFITKESNIPYLHSVAPTAPLAICRAALKAVAK
jgi:YHS domain-containing protein